MSQPMPIDRLSMTTLRLFVAVVEEGSLSKAAERESIATSAASRRLNELESGLDVALFTRNSRGMQLTLAGESLLQHARRMLLAASALSSELLEYRRGIRGHIRMLANLSAIVAYLPEELERFFLIHPDLRIELEERPTSGVVRGIKEGWAEVGVCSGDSDLEGLATRSFRRDRLVMLMRADHPLSGTGPISFADTLPFDQVALHAESSIFTRSQMAARDAGRSLRRRIHVPGFDAICRTVQAGLGIGLVPEPIHALFGRAMQLRFEHLMDAWAHRQLKLVWRSDRALSTAAQQLVEHLQIDG
ncbi:LysR family transcriptional regulator [Xanthomonas medicagonis]|uniref:LysR family transcriptional regulator n=1 Tax=Xanthomonas medicagonis TaxID=3160841 RepID=UPI00351467E7